MSEQVSASGPIYRASREENEGFDPRAMRLLYVSAGVGVALLAAIGAYSLMGHGNGDVPVIAADTRPIKEKPANPGGMQVMARETRTDPSQSRLAPATEEPNPAALLTSSAASTAIPAGGAAKPPAPASAADAKTRGKTITVQLSMAKSEADAQAVWDRLAKKLPEALGARRPLFQKISESGHTPWRLRTAGFADQAQARAFCDQVKAKGGKCVVMLDS